MSDSPTAVQNSVASGEFTASANSAIVNPGQYKPGQSGNPAGRPRGSRNRATVAALALLGEAGERLMRAGIDRALDGDSLLLRCCIMRLAPVPRGRPVELDLAEGSAASDVLASMTATVRAMAEGTLSPLEATDVAGVLEVQRRAIETCDLDHRLTRLEAAGEMLGLRKIDHVELDDDEDTPALLPDSVLDDPFDAPDEPPAAAPGRHPS